MTIQALLAQPESKTLEFKQDLSSTPPILKTLVAFANTAGGVLILGIDDKKKLLGIDDPLAIEEKLTSLIADSIAPLLLPTIKIATIDDKSLLIIEVPHVSHLGPFYLKQKGKEQGTMVRLGSSSRLATPEMIRELERYRQAQSFDALPCVQASADDLDYELITKTFESTQLKIDKTKLKTLKLLVTHGKDYIPSNAAIILFGKSEIREQLFPMAYVSCARFAGTEKVNFIDQLDIESILAAVDEVPKFIRRNTRMGAIIKDIKRKDVPEYSTIAVREGLLNALMHADYSYSNMRHFISIFDDRLEIRSPGCLPPGMTIESIKEGLSIPRNLVIARVFKELGWVEQFGTGYRRIKEACDKEGYRIPEWRELGPYTDVVFKPLKVEVMHDLGPSRDQVGTKSAPSAEELQILAFCKEPQPINAIMALLGWKNRTKFRKKYILPLLEKELLELTIPDKPQSSKQKYKTV